MFQFYGCKIFSNNISEYQTESYFQIKNRYIDPTLPGSIVIVEGNVFVIEGNPFKDTIIDCDGQISNGVIGSDYFEGK
ncbi:MAG: hypothetical protein R2771_16610 [Saprospiraceae bacterium]